MNKNIVIPLFGCLLLLTTGSNALAATSTARIGFSSKTVGLSAVNTRTAGTSEYVEIGFIDTNGIEDLSVPVLIDSTDTSLVAVSNAPVGNALGNYQLTIPANAIPGSTASINVSATVGGVNYTRTRGFVVAAVVPPVVVPPAPNAGVSTTLRAATPTLAADQSGCAAINYYDVGPNKAYSAISQLPWSKLQGCDTVRIYPKVNNDAYHEMMLLSAGTNLAPAAPNKFMRVIGMPDPITGARPIIDGSADTNGVLATQLETLPGQASRTLQYHDNGSASRVLYKLGLVMVGPQSGYAYNNGPAGYIGIENLDIRNAVYNAPFADALKGGQDTFSSFGTCLFVEVGAHLVVKNNVFHNCGNGLFINSKNSSLVELSQDVLIDGNRFYSNSNAPIAGVTNGFSEHNSYTEARDIIFQYNYFGDLRPGAGGACLKDRSSGLIVRYNTFASNCGLTIDLEDSTGGQQLIWGDAGYAKTHVYGNLFDQTVGAYGNNLIHYGGDSGTAANYRQGTLFFYNNTMRLKGDALNANYPEILLFNMDRPNAVADVKNNVFYTSPTTAGAKGKIQAMLVGHGTANLTNNWVSPNAAPYWLGHLTGAIVTGWNTNLGANNQTLFVNEALHNFRPAVGSPLIDAGNDLSNINLSNLPIAEPSQVAVRKQDWIMDIGAYEY